MSLIKNLIKEPEKNDNDANDNSDDGESKTSKRPIIKSATDLQRLRLEKLMKNPDKPIVIPEPKYSKNSIPEPPSFVRNVMGSSAGAGSGEFHVYRHLRRKEYARQKTIQIKSYNEQLDEEFQKKLEENRRIAEEKTAKKRAKRMKKKKRAKKERKSIENKQNKQDEDEEQDKSPDDSGTGDEGALEEKSKPNLECNEKSSNTGMENNEEE